MVAMQWQGGVLSLLDQGAYPQEEKWLTCNTWEETAQALATPAVQEEKVAAIAAAYGYAQAAIAAQDKLGTDAFQAALDSGKAAVIDCVIDKDAKVHPMVNGGHHITEFLLS